MPKENNYFISLGAGFHQKPLIEAAKKKGLKLIGIDIDLNALGLSLCDLRVQESILNYRKIHLKLMMLMLDAEIAGGFSASYGKALYSWAFLCERFHLIGLSRTQVESLLDKVIVRDKIQRAEPRSEYFRQPKYIAIESRVKKAEIDNLGYPQVIKSRFGASKKNIFCANSYIETKEILLKSNLKAAGLLAREIIIEEKIAGDEITVVGFIQDFKFHLVSISDKITTSEPPFIELEHRFPSKYNDQAEKIIKIHDELTGILELPVTPLVSEWKVYKDEFYLIELSPQIPGEYIASFMIPKGLKYDYFANLVSLTIGEPVLPSPIPKTKKKITIKYWPSKISKDSWEEEKKKAYFARILNENPHNPPNSNMDRFGVMGFIN